MLETPGGGSPHELPGAVHGVADLWEWIPNGLLVLAGVFLVVWVPLRSRRHGLAMYAVGSDATPPS